MIEKKGTILLKKSRLTVLTNGTTIVVPHLVKALRSEHQSVRYWCTQIAWKYPDPRLIDPLENILRNDAVDVRVFAASTLGFFPGKTVDRILLDALSNENETDIVEAITEAIEARGLSGDPEI